MAQVIYARRALEDFERLIAHAAEVDPDLSRLVVARVREAVSLLHEHPLIGRPVEAGLRELVISRGRTGYLASYRYLEAEDVVLVLALRHQREPGYSGPGA